MVETSATKGIVESSLYEKRMFSDLYLHTLMVNYPFLDYADSNAHNFDRDLMKYYETIGKRPEICKSYNKKIKLNSFWNIDWNRLKSNIKNINTIAFLFSVSFGKIMEIFWPTHKIRKSVPSGGSKHPTEVYVIFIDDFYVRRGIYHYNSADYSLEIVSNNERDMLLFEKSALVSETKKNGLFYTIYTSVYERSMWRYRDIRSTRAVLIDLGHIIQGALTNFKLLGFNSGTVQNLNYEILEKMLKLEKYRESVHSIQYHY